MDKVKELLEDGTSVTTTTGVRRPDGRQDQAEVEQYKHAGEHEHQDLTMSSGKDHADSDEGASERSGSMQSDLLSWPSR
jgi:hypothetical protein